MVSKDFPERNLKIAEHQDEYETLYAYHNPKEGSVTFCFQLNKEEIDQILNTGEIYFKQLTFGAPMQPVAMSVDKVDLIP